MSEIWRFPFEGVSAAKATQISKVATVHWAEAHIFHWLCASVRAELLGA